MRDKSALVRLALDGSRVVLDPAATRPGRGAYVCNRACAERALARKALNRSFRRAVEVEPNVVDLLGD